MRPKEHVAIERDRVRDRGHLQVHVPHPGARREAVERGLRVLELAEEALDVEWERRHPPSTCPSQTLARSIPVDPIPCLSGSER